MQDARGPNVELLQRPLGTPCSELADADDPLGIESTDDPAQVAVARGVEGISLGGR